MKNSANQSQTPPKKTLKERDDKVVYTSYVETEKSILEQLNLATRATRATYATDTKFIIYDKFTASIDYLEEFEYKGTTYKPIVDDLLKVGVISLPSGIEEYGTTADLAKEIYDFLYENFEVPSFYQEFLPYIVMFSWVYEKFPFVPYLHFVGLTGTGKTTAAEAVTALCYKPIDAAGAITMSPIFRMASSWKGTLFLDEFEPNGDGYSDMIAFLKSGVGNRAVLRTEGDTRREVKAYSIKSMKVFTSERPITNAGLRSRMFVIEMEKSTRKIPLIKQKSFYDKAQTIRNKLLLWRLRNFPKIDLSKIEYGYPELSTFDRRVQQVLTPIYYLSDEESRKTILSFAKTQEIETKRERAESIEGEIFQIIADMIPVDPSLKEIAEKLNTDRSRKLVTEKKIANVVRQILHFDIQRIGHSMTSTILANEKPERIADLSDYFGIDVVGLGIPLERVARVASEKNEDLEHKDVTEDATRCATRPQNCNTSTMELLDENGIPIDNEEE